MRVDGVSIPMWLLVVLVVFAIWYFGFRKRQMDAALAVVVGLISPLVFKYVPLKGVAMVLVTWILSFLLAAGDLYVTQGSSAFTAAKLASTFAIIYATQQVVFAAFQKNEPAAVGDGPATVVKP